MINQLTNDLRDRAQRPERTDFLTEGPRASLEGEGKLLGIALRS